MKSVKNRVRFLLLSVIVVAVCGCGGGGGASVPTQQSSSSAIAASTTTSVDHGTATAVCTVTISGASSPVIYGFDLNLNYPAGATVAAVNTTSLTASGILSTVSGVKLAASTPFGSGDVLTVNYTNVPSSAQSTDFSVSNFVAFDGNGNEIH